MTGIKGISKKIKGPIPVTITFSGEDLSVAFDYGECSNAQWSEMIKGMNIGKAITPDVIKKLKQEDLFVQALESSADRLSKYLELGKSGKNLDMRVEFHDNGVIKVYINGEMIENGKQDNLKEDLLIPLRKSILHQEF